MNQLTGKIPILLVIIIVIVNISCKKNIDIQKPVAFFNVFPKNGNTVTDFQFDASETIIEGDDRELFYRWDWEGDGEWDIQFSKSPETSHKYSLKGTYHPVLEVKNSSGMSDSIKIELIVEQGNSPPRPSFIVNRSRGNIKTVFSFDGSKTKDDEDSLNTLKFRWDWESDGYWDTDYLQEPYINHIFPDIGIYRINMEVVDTSGLTARISKKVTVDLINEMLLVDFTISPDSGTSRDIFTFDASPCRDLENNTLEFEYYWILLDKNDLLIYDSGLNSEKILSWKFDFHQFGRKKINLRIIDKDGLINSVTKFFTVHYDNKPPTADFIAVPKRGNINNRIYFNSEEFCTDPDEAWWSLFYRWDFDNDGIWDTDFSRFNRKMYFQYSSPGVYNAILEIKDSGGLTDTAQFQIIVSNGTNETGFVKHKLGSIENPKWQYYSIVKIGDQWWFSENLNINNEFFKSDRSVINNYLCYLDCNSVDMFAFTKAYRNDELIRQKFGGLYPGDYLITLKLANEFNNITGCRSDGRGGIIPCGKIDVRACPDGWRVPTSGDWDQLIDYLGPDGAEKLKPGGSTDFYALYGGEGKNIPSGDIVYNGLGDHATFASLDFDGVFTTNTYMTNVIKIFKNNKEVEKELIPAFSSFSVRCVKNN